MLNRTVNRKFNKYLMISVKFTKWMFIVVSFRSHSQISVIFIRSSSFGQVNNPPCLLWDLACLKVYAISHSISKLVRNIQLLIKQALNNLQLSKTIQKWIIIVYQKVLLVLFLNLCCQKWMFFLYLIISSTF